MSDLLQCQTGRVGADLKEGGSWGEVFGESKSEWLERRGGLGSCRFRSQRHNSAQILAAIMLDKGVKKA